MHFLFTQLASSTYLWNWRLCNCQLRLNWDYHNFKPDKYHRNVHSTNCRFNLPVWAHIKYTILTQFILHFTAIRTSAFWWQHKTVHRQSVWFESTWFRAVCFHKIATGGFSWVECLLTITLRSMFSQLNIFVKHNPNCQMQFKMLIHKISHK